MYMWDNEAGAPDVFDMLSPVQGSGDRATGGMPRIGVGPERRPHERRPRTPRRSDTLSQREIAVLDEIARGTPTEEVARKLHVSPHTVRTHIKNILRKLDARTRAHAVAIALSEDAIDNVHEER
jgi:DNA-binding CsgD family transcriptional regulator